MEYYKDLDNDSSISGYDIGPDSITIYFKSGGAYLYTYQSAGSSNIEQMKRLAQSGEGLNSYIMKFVKNNYARKL
ncbi:hypothetical protein [Leptospira sanjuanensis]|uniref:hypothetical protein n=1 Tax=Leptospira sanjuanensis TaxID=2879643 RepID=UPI001EE90455|nr:hypothetical protein [Leptospira sanjuanensis]MCG6169731.1 hypothetical protein [Leptospira sanjuanensis]